MQIDAIDRVIAQECHENTNGEAMGDQAGGKPVSGAFPL